MSTKYASPWDEKFDANPAALEAWLYGKASLDGATRHWFIEEASKWPEGTTLLDAGCGGGVTAYHLQQAGLLGRILYTGMDGSKSMLALARRKVVHSAATFERQNLARFQSRRQFDRVLLRAVLEHCRDPEPVLRAVCRCVARNGTLYIVWWNNPVFGGPIPQMTDLPGVPDTAHDAERVLSILDGAGFPAIRRTEVEESSARGQKMRVIWICRRTTT